MDHPLSHPWVIKAAYFALGIAMATVPWWAALLGFMALAIMVCRRFASQGREVVAALLLAASGFMYFSWHQLPVPDALPVEQDAVLSGIVVGYPRVQEQRSSLVIKTDLQSPYLRRIQVFCNFETRLIPGTAVELTGVLQRPAFPGNPGEFDYPAYLARHHIYYLLQVEKPQDLKEQPREHRLPAFSPQWRARMVEQTRAVLPEQEAGLILGMVLGIIDNLDEDLYQDFQRTGLVHLFAVSGLNVGFVIVLASLIIAAARLNRQVGMYLTIFMILLYSSLTGWPISVQRAVIMAVLSLLAAYLGRNHDPANGLGLAALIILALDPCSLFTISFQLSFLATWGLVVLYPALKGYFNIKQRLWDLLLVPVCAQLAVLPVIAYYFHLITPVSIISNLLATYLAGVIVILGFVALLLLLLFPWLSAVLLIPAGFCAHVLLAINAWCKTLPLAYWMVATPPLAVVGLYFAGLLWLVPSLRAKARRAQLIRPVLLISSAVLLLLIPPWWLEQGRLELAFIDVGQGDSILLKSPSNRFVLIDGGGSIFTDIGRRKVLPYLNHLGVNRLYMVINTHPDVDHINGLLAVMQDRKVDYVGVAEASLEEPALQNLLALARQKGSRVLALKQGQTLDIDGLTLSVWYPPGTQSADEELNHQSLVLFCRLGRFSALLTGDQSSENLAQCLKQHREKSLIVKVPHHGSRYAWHADLAKDAQWLVLSVGKNAFGHPHQEVLQDIEKSDARLLRTDHHGLISFSSDGRTLQVETFKSGS
ncbi:MAG: DNA internalization-related competence protein ComEC/Rec2 [Syntrophomonadaceae bacterium]|jgi:competence protein ComEC|nr:DNA internalization-related competence protein ComEC/Rec2 [Syntrophomonadaceae bacterium]